MRIKEEIKKFQQTNDQIRLCVIIVPCVCSCYNL